MYKCTNCWQKSAFKLGKCPGCWQFWTLEEIFEEKKQSQKSQSKWRELKTKKNKKEVFFEIENQEFKRIFQKWIKEWWIYLIWWEPGIWKSTIILQIIKDIIQKNQELNVWYFSWEETPQAILERFERISKEKDKNHIKIFHSTQLEDITTTAEIQKYDIIIIDSIQTVYSQNINSPSWSPNQVKYCSEKISEICKKTSTTWLIVWHVTKWWEIAWPKYLEHIVDVVAYLEWDRFWQYRFLRNKKNRFWNTDDIWIFEMTNAWLQAVYNIKEKIMSNIHNKIPWSVLTIWLDNWRPVIANVEILINKTRYKYPSRTAIWMDNNRLTLIIAIVEKYLKINLWYYDIFANIPWEFKFNDSWIDLAIAAAIYSQYKNQIIDKKYVFIWEVGLWWQILSSKLHQKRLKEIKDEFENIDFNRIKNIKDITNVI